MGSGRAESELNLSLHHHGSLEAVTDEVEVVVCESHGPPSKDECCATLRPLIIYKLELYEYKLCDLVSHTPGGWRDTMSVHARNDESRSSKEPSAGRGWDPTEPIGT